MTTKPKTENNTPRLTAEQKDALALTEANKANQPPTEIEILTAAYERAQVAVDAVNAAFKVAAVAENYAAFATLGVTLAECTATLTSASDALAVKSFNQSSAKMMNQLVDLIADTVDLFPTKPRNVTLRIDYTINPTLTTFVINSAPTATVGSAKGTRGRASKFRVVVDNRVLTHREYIAEFGTDADKGHSHVEKFPTKLARTIADRDVNAAHEVFNDIDLRIVHAVNADADDADDAESEESAE